MTYNWEDLRDDRIEVEWGENHHPLGAGRRARAPGYGQKKSGWKSATIVGVSTLAAIGIAAMVALTLIESPIPKRENGPTNAEGMDEVTVVSTPQPTLEPSAQPTSGPSTAWPTASPSIAESAAPSAMASAVPSIAGSALPTSSALPSASPSMSPSEVPKAPPAPEPEPEPELCIDQPGDFHNHAGDKVTCEWLMTVGTYNFKKNCENTDLGQACLLTCADYNDCILPSDAPSNEPSSFPSPSSLPPTMVPTPTPPKSITLEATGDATIKDANPNASLGSSSWLKIDEAKLPQDLGFGETDSGNFHSMLRFDLSQHNSNRPVESAVLRLKAGNDCPSGGYLEKTDSPHWDETAITWATAPEGDGVEIGRLGSIESGFWYEIDVSSALHHGHEALSLRLYPASSDECLFASKDKGDGGDGPRLHIEYEDW